MKNAIVTGANSFVGSATTRELLSNGINVCAVVHDGRRDNLLDHHLLKVVSCDLDEILDLPKRIGVGSWDAFYHFAWAGASGQARADTHLQLSNVQWAVDALRAAKELDCKKFICAGTIMERETAAAVYTQGNHPGPAYTYGGGKLAAHVMCASVAAQLGIDLVWAEITNAYGVGERSVRLINSTIAKCIRGEEPEFTSGTQNYDFVYIDDVARAFRLIGEKGKPFHTYLIGSSKARPLREFLLEMNNEIAPEMKFHFGSVPYTGISLPLEEFDCKQTENDTGFSAKVGFAEGCRKTYEWLKEE